MNTATTKSESALTPEILAYIEQWKNKPGNLIMVLHRVQEHFGYVPRSAAFEVADLLSVPVAKIYGVVTFYHFFKLKKPGHHRIQVCLGTACYLKGAESLITELETLLGIGLNATTPDNEFSIEAVRCVGCCGLAPVMMIDKQVYGNLVPEQLPAIIAKHRSNQ